MKTSILLSLAVLAFAHAGLLRAQAPAPLTGEIDGAKFIILQAHKPVGKVLLLAHGYRHPGQPLSAGFDQQGRLSRTLLSNGWTIASTSYRRNGWIIDDALADLKALQAKIESLQGKPTTTYLLGNSMGAQIAVLAAEGGLEIDGAITTGAALQAGLETNAVNPKISFKPKVPVIHLINKEQNRIYTRIYQKKAGDAASAHWKIQRPGHCNVSDREKLAAINALDRWRAGEKIPADHDATIPPDALDSTARPALIGTVRQVSESWGNVSSSFVASDLETLEVKLGGELLVRHGNKEQRLKVAEHYSQVRQGRGVAYVTPEGHLQLQMNGARLAPLLGVKAGDQLILSAAR